MFRRLVASRGFRLCSIGFHSLGFSVFALAAFAMVAAEAGNAGTLQPPDGRKIRVAVVLTEGAVVIDYAGPWEVFSNVHTGSGDMDRQMPFDLYTVGRDRTPIHTAGVMKPGMTVTPDFGFADAPDPDVVVVGAQAGDEQLGPWLKKVHANHALILSVCTGAFKLAQAGLLDGKSATTHHASLQRLANQYPRIAVQSSVRYVQSDPLIVTAGGLSSGIDAALHVVELYYGTNVAQAAADYMEYQGLGWKTNAGSGQPLQIEPTIPLAHRGPETHWQGTLHPSFPRNDPQVPLLLHLAQVAGQYRATLDVPSESTIGMPLTDVSMDQGHLHFTMDSDEGPFRFDGTITANQISGNLARDHSLIPLRLVRSGN